MSSVAPQQGSAVGTAETPRAAEPQYMSLNRVAAYSPDNVIARISILSTDARVIPVEGSHDQNIASLETGMAQYRNTAHNVNPPLLLAKTGSQFQ